MKNKQLLTKVNDSIASINSDAIPITTDLSEKQLEQLVDLANETKRQVTESAVFNDYNKSEEYQFSLLIQEGVRLVREIKKPAKVEPSLDLTEMKLQLKAHVKKHGLTEKAKSLQSKINMIEQDMLTRSYKTLIESELNDSGRKAEVIMAAKGIQEDIISMQTKISDVQFKYMDGLISKITEAYGTDTANEIKEKMMQSMDELMTQIRSTKDQMANVVNTLSGTGDMGDSMTEEEPNDDMDSFDLDDEDNSTDDSEASDGDGSEKDGDDDFSLDDLMDDEGKGEDKVDDDFKRKK